MMLALTRFKDPEFILHEFGHKIPPLSIKQKKKIVAFMKKYGLVDQNMILANSKLWFLFIVRRMTSLINIAKIR